MIQRNIINVVGDTENLVDSLLAHAEEENCQHSISDFLQEYFDNKNKRGAEAPTASNSQQDKLANDNSNPQWSYQESD